MIEPVHGHRGLEHAVSTPVGTSAGRPSRNNAGRAAAGELRPAPRRYIKQTTRPRGRAHAEGSRPVMHQTPLGPWAGRGLAAVALGVALAGCGGTPEVPTPASTPLPAVVPPSSTPAPAATAPLPAATPSPTATPPA